MNRQTLPTDDELRCELERLLTRYFKKTVRVLTLRRRVSPYASSSRIENLHVRLSSGRFMKMVFKDLSPAARLTAAWKVRPDFVDDPLREIATYRRILEPLRPGTPALYGALTDHRARRYWLFNESIRGCLLWQVGRLDAWKEAARWLARFHARGTQLKLSRALRYDEEFYRAWIQRAARFHRQRNRRQKIERLASRYDRVIANLRALPRTLIHGEFYPSNVLVRAGRTRGRICPIDWEMTAFAPGAMDLAALTAGNWTGRQAMEIIGAYRDASDGASSLRDLAEAVEWSRLHLAVQMLGWSDRWTAPKPHSRDWLDDAMRHAKQLGVIS